MPHGVIACCVLLMQVYYWVQFARQTALFQEQNSINFLAEVKAWREDHIPSLDLFPITTFIYKQHPAQQHCRIRGYHCRFTVGRDPKTVVPMAPRPVADIF